MTGQLRATQRDQQVCLTVERLVWRGRALAHLPDGKVALVQPGVFPGEVVQGVVTRDRKGHAEVLWKRVVEASPVRRPHPCPVSGRCAGCVFGVIPNRQQLHWKKELFLQELRRNLGPYLEGQELPLLEIFPSHPAWRYRWRGQIQVKDGRPHFFSYHSHKLIPVHDCLLFSPPLGRSLLHVSKGLPDGRVTVASSPLTSQAHVQGDSSWLRLPYAHLDLELWILPGAFFQANWKLNQELIHFVVHCLQAQDRVADLYAGAGNFSLPLAWLGKKILALEGDRQALQGLEKSVSINKVQGLSWQGMDLAKVDLQAVLQNFAPQAVVLDPPRMGCGRKKVAGLTGLASLERVVWVSCDLVNTCRDLDLFLRQGWKISRLALFDLFPQTWHFEAVLVLDRVA